MQDDDDMGVRIVEVDVDVDVMWFVLFVQVDSTRTIAILGIIT